MTSPTAARPAPPARRGRVGGVLVTVTLAALAGVLVQAGVAEASTPAVTVSPESGGPGSAVTVSGRGFCARAGCAAVRVTIAGRQFATDQRPDAAGAFRTRTQAPGGLTPGEHDVVATQVLDDGNEISASASFVYSPSRGEAAEREAENRDAVTNLVNTAAPTPAPRGVPLASAIAEIEASASAAADASRSPASSAPASRAAPVAAERSTRPYVPVLLVAAGVAALLAGALWWRRRTPGGTS